MVGKSISTCESWCYIFFYLVKKLMSNHRSTFLHDGHFEDANKNVGSVTFSSNSYYICIWLKPNNQLLHCHYLSYNKGIVVDIIFRNYYLVQNWSEKQIYWTSYTSELSCKQPGGCETFSDQCDRKLETHSQSTNNFPT